MVIRKRLIALLGLLHQSSQTSSTPSTWWLLWNSACALVIHEMTEKVIPRPAQQFMTISYCFAWISAKQYFVLVITLIQPAFNECFEAVIYCLYNRLQYLSVYISVCVWFQLRYQKCLDARPPSSISCLPGPPADSVARRVGSSVKKGVQSLLGTFKRSGAQTPWENESSPQRLSISTSLFTTVCPPPVSCRSQSSVEHAFHFSWPLVMSSGFPTFLCRELYECADQVLI